MSKKVIKTNSKRRSSGKVITSQLELSFNLDNSIKEQVLNPAAGKIVSINFITDKKKFDFIQQVLTNTKSY